MNTKLKNVIKIIIAICIIILIVDIIYFCYQKVNKSAKTTYFDSINSFQALKDGYIAVGSNNDNKKGYEKGKITKYDNKYNKVWEKFYNHGFNSTFYSVVLSDDGYVAVGSYQKNKQEQKDNVTSALLVKYDKDGNEEFSRTMQILGDSRFKNVKVVDDGYIVVGQSIYENSTLGTSSSGGAIIVKYDKSGKLLWQDNYGGNKSGLYNDLVVDDEAIYVAGKNYGRVGVVSKYSLDGKRLLTTTYESTDTLGFTGIDKVGESLVVVGAKKISKDEYDHDIDALVVHYNLDCEKIGEVTYKGRGLERFNTLVHDDKDNLIIVGHSGVLDKENSTKKENKYIYQGLLAKYKSNLKEVYVISYGENKNAYFTDLALVKNYYLVGGYSQYKKEGYFSKFLTYTTAGKLLEVNL